MVQLVCSGFGTLGRFSPLRLLFSLRPASDMDAGCFPSQYKRLPVHFGGFCPFTGRTPIQVVRSVLAYLDWRMGAAWRPLSHRWHADRLYYLDGARLVIECWNAPAETSAIPVREISPKKPPERVEVGRAAKGGAA